MLVSVHVFVVYAHVYTVCICVFAVYASVLCLCVEAGGGCQVTCSTTLHLIFLVRICSLILELGW